MRRLDGKTAFVTGAAQGIGRATVNAFVAEGARVAAADINPQKLGRLPRHLSIETCVLDVTDDEAIRLVARRFGDIDIVVNCAGIVASGTILTSTQSEFELSWRVNVGSVFSMTRAFVPAMIERKQGSIINIASVVSTVWAAPDRCVYATSKGAVIALTKSVALDLIKLGIRCNAISPGTIRTPSLDERMAACPDPHAATRAFVDRQPMGRLGAVEEVAAVAVLLASDETAFMTGSNIVIDGGLSL